MTESADKVCVLCGRTCAGQPRIKNAEGEYAHRSCAEKKAAAAPPTAMAADLDDDNLMGALLDDLPAPAQAETGNAPGLRAACPGCGVSMTPGAVICMSCGFDTRSGKAGKTKVTAAKAGAAAGIGGLAASAGAAAGAGAATLVGAAIGASIAGALGAAVWAASSSPRTTRSGTSPSASAWPAASAPRSGPGATPGC